MEVLLLAVMGITNLCCFMIGAKVAQKVIKGEPVQLPEINPMKVIQEKEAKKAADKQQEEFNAMLHNIECYDGTSYGQKDIPGR